jgi:hypothetical protein
MMNYDVQQPVISLWTPLYCLLRSVILINISALNLEIFLLNISAPHQLYIRIEITLIEREYIWQCWAGRVNFPVIWCRVELELFMISLRSIILYTNRHVRYIYLCLNGSILDNVNNGAECDSLLLLYIIRNACFCRVSILLHLAIERLPQTDRQ